MLPNLIGVAGGFGAGKDTIANFLVANYGYIRLDFGDVLKGEVKAALESEVVRTDIWDEMPSGCREAMVDCLALNVLDPFAKPTTAVMRRLLQQYGTEFRRAQDKNWWCDAVRNEWIALGRPKTVIPSMRFHNEAEFGRNEGGVIWLVTRPTAHYAYAELAKHASERELDDYAFDRVFTNDGTLPELEVDVALELAVRYILPPPEVEQPLQL